MKILWCITGAGEFLRESVEVMKGLDDKITVFLSKAGEEVAKQYGVLGYLEENCETAVDSDDAAREAGKVVLGRYQAVVVSPATANTVAKIANGMADNLITTAVSLALKSGVPVYMVPTDWVEGNTEIPDFLTPGGAKVRIKPRKSDLRNLKYLEEEGIKLLQNPGKLKEELQ
jgi:dihydromethanopterin reductase (acceptor)